MSATWIARFVSRIAHGQSWVGTDHRFAAQMIPICGGCAVCSGNAEAVGALAQPKVAERGSTNSHGVLQHGCEHRLQLAGRAANDLQDRRGRGLLLQRLGELFFKSSMRASYAVAFVLVERRLVVRLRLFAPLRDKVTSSAQS